MCHFTERIDETRGPAESEITVGPNVTVEPDVTADANGSIETGLPLIVGLRGDGRSSDWRG